MTMKLYEVTAPVVNVITGTVRVTPDQFRARRHALMLVGEAEDGTVEATVTQSVGFKRGEVFGYDGEMPRVLAVSMSEVEEQSVMDFELEDMDQKQLLAFARELGLSPHHATGKPKLIELIRAREDELVESGELKVEE